MCNKYVDKDDIVIWNGRIIAGAMCRSCWYDKVEEMDRNMSAVEKAKWVD